MSLSDKYMDDQLKSVFESKTFKAPVSIWSKIENGMKHSPNDQSSNTDAENHDAAIDQSIKDSFLTSSVSAPTGLWGKINDNLAETTPTSKVDDQLDQKIQQSYQEHKVGSVPSKVWDGIRKKLVFDGIWRSIDSELNQRPILSDWRIKMAQYMGVACIFLLFIRNCTPYYQPENEFVFSTVTDQSNHILGPTQNEHQENLSNNSLLSDLDTKNDEQGFSNSKVQEFTEYSNDAAYLSTISTTEEIEQKNTPDRNIIARTDIIDPNISANEPPILGLTDALEEKEHIIASTSNIEKNDLSTAPSTQYSNTTGVIIKRDTLISSPELNKIHDQKVILIADHLQVSLNQINTPTLNDLSNRFSAGVFSTIHAGMIYNNLTRNALAERNQIEYNYQVAANYGLWAAYQFNTKSAITLEFSINAEMKQRYVDYNMYGLPVNQDWVFEYNRIALSYKHIFTHKLSKGFSNALVGEAGWFVGFLRTARVFYDGELFYDALVNHHRLDMGPKLSLGHELHFGHFVFSYGVRSDVGILNIFKGNSVISSADNRTNTIQFGGFVQMGYTF